MAKLKKLTEQEMSQYRKRFNRLLTEYSFVNQESDLLLDEDEDDESPEAQGANTPEIGVNPAPDKAPEMNDAAGPEQGEEPQMNIEPDPQADPNLKQDPNTDTPPANTNIGGLEMPDSIGGENEVEVDVTDLTKKQDDVTSAVGNLSNETSQILNTLMSLTDKIESNIKKTASEIEDIKREVVKRNPTPVEVLQKRITVSDPFNQTPADYWKKKESEGGYRLSDDDDADEKEYTIKGSDIGGSASEIYKSFGLTDDEMNQSIDTLFKF